MFGDNQSVVTSASLPHSVLNKRHHALAFHKVRESIAAGILNFHWIDSKCNLADILSKHWDYASVSGIIKHLFDWQGKLDWNKLGSPTQGGE